MWREGGREREREGGSEGGREQRREGGGEGVYCRNNGRALGLVVMTVGRAREC